MQLTITKTLGGWTPAVDEIEVFDISDQINNFEDYFKLKTLPRNYFIKPEYSQTFLSDVLNNNISFNIRWRTDENTGYSNQVIEIPLQVKPDYQPLKVFIPRRGKLIKVF